MPQFNINLFTFNKKDNSTKVPTVTGTAVKGEFKTGFDLLAPTVKIYDITSPPSYNYAQIPILNRYYFIENWSFSAGFWYASLAVDVLGSWKTAIGSQSLYVTRAASSSDEYILDAEYPTTGQITVLESVTTDPPFGSAGGCYVVGIVGGANSTGAISYYAFSPAAFQHLIGNLLGDINWMNIDVTDLSEELQKALINPAQYISSCLWIPVDVGSVPGTSVGSIPVGWWSFTASATQIYPLGARVGDSFALTIPKHPKAATRGKYLNISPYSDYTLHFFPFGTIALDSLRLQDETTLNLRYILDCCTGEAVMYVTCGGDPIKIVTGRFGVPVPTGQISVQIGGLSSMATTAGMSAAAGAVSHAKEFLQGVKTFAYKLSGRGDVSGAAAESMKGTASNILSSAVSALATVDVSGQMGSNLYATVPVSLVGRFLDIVDEDLQSRGRPLCQRVTINTLSGYFQCSDADIEIGCTAREREIIINYLLSGCFYE